MRKLFLVATLSITLLASTITSQAATTKNYYLTGTIKNYTTTIQYNDGTTYKSNGIEFHDNKGNIWLYEGDYNKSTDGIFTDNSKVKVKMSTCGTKSQHDDIIVSIQSVK
jgi:hypothetical protein